MHSSQLPSIRSPPSHNPATSLCPSTILILKKPTGFGTAFIERSTLLLRGCGGGITAWKGTYPTNSNLYGVYISDSHVLAANSTIAASDVGKCALGRPWNALIRSVYMNTYLDATVQPQGFIEWQDTDPRVNGSTLMAEWKSYGPGYNQALSASSNVTILLSDEEVKTYRTPGDVYLGDGVKWIDREFYPF